MGEMAPDSTRASWAGNAAATCTADSSPQSEFADVLSQEQQSSSGAGQPVHTDPTAPTPREQAAQQCLPENERYLPPRFWQKTNGGSLVQGGGHQTGGILGGNATKPVCVAGSDQANPGTGTTSINAGPQSKPIRVLPHIHLEDHHEDPKTHKPDPHRVSMQDDCDFYKGKADALVFMEHVDFYNSKDPKKSCTAGPDEPVAILGSECYVTINRNGSNVAHHTGIWFVDSDLQRSSGLNCGASPKDEKAAVVKAGGLLSFHHPEYPYVDKMSSAKALAYTLPKDQAEPFDMVEVWNKGGFGASDIEGVLKWTERNFYDRGMFPAAISGMDDHGPDRKAKQGAFTMIDSNGGTDRDAIKAAVQARKTWVSTDENARVSVDTSKKGEATFNLSHLKPGSTVEIIQDGKSLGKQAITGDSFSSTVKGSSGYAYAKVYDAKNKPDLYLVTSAAQLK
jgi:hypothetical protein